MSKFATNPLASDIKQGTKINQSKNHDVKLINKVKIMVLF